MCADSLKEIDCDDLEIPLVTTDQWVFLILFYDVEDFEIGSLYEFFIKYL